MTNYSPVAEPRGKARHDAITRAVLSDDWSEVEAWDGVHDANVHAHLDPTRRGEAIAYTTPAPSWHVATQSTRKVRRGKKGTQTTIVHRGRVVVVGDSQAMDDGLTRSARVPRSVVSHAIDALRGGNRFGHVDGDALAALTSRLYDVPDLIGSDHWSWSQATPEIPSSGAAVLAAQTCGLSGGAVPLLDAAVGPEYRTTDSDPRWFPTSYPRKHYPRRHTARLRLSIPRRRKADPAPREHVVMGDRSMPWRAWWHVVELPAPNVDGATLWHGHRVVTRGETVKSPKRAPIRETFVVRGDIVHVLPNLAASVMDDGAARYAWRVEGTDHAGLLTIDAQHRASITGNGITPIRQVRTVEALRRRLSRAVTI